MYDVELGNCGSVLAVDGLGGRWTEGGCENGAPPYCLDGRMSRAGAVRYRAALDRLRAASPSVGDGGMPDCSRAVREPIPTRENTGIRSFTLVEASGATRRWQLCPGAKLPRVFQDVLDVVR